MPGCQHQLSAISRTVKCGPGKWEKFAISDRDASIFSLFSIDLPAPTANCLHQNPRPDATLAFCSDSPRSYDAMSDATIRESADEMTRCRQRPRLRVFVLLQTQSVARYLQLSQNNGCPEGLSLSIIFGRLPYSGSRPREQESSTPPRRFSRPRGNQWHALCSHQDWN